VYIRFITQSNTGWQTATRLHGQ